MNIVIILLSFILVISSLFLILLVLVQLPKKEAGLGQAFGSSTTLSINWSCCRYWTGSRGAELIRPA